MPKVSIIIPNYNNSEYLAGCINSVRAQTFQDIEIIVVDDCSKDDSQKVIKKLVAIDRRIVFHKMAKNSGVGMARNAGIAIARGEFVMFLDSDDLLCPTAVDGLMMVQNGTSADMVVGNYTRVAEDFHIPNDAAYMPPTFAFEGFEELNDFVQKIDNLNLVTVWGKLIRRRIVKDLRFVPIHPHEDVEFMLRLYGRTRVGAITPNLAVYYRLSATSVMADKARDVSKNIAVVLESIAATALDYDDNYMRFVKRYAYVFLRLWLGSMVRKIKKASGNRPEQRKLRVQMKFMSKCVRRILKTGVFHGINVSAKHMLALRLFGWGFILSSANMLMYKDGKI